MPSLIQRIPSGFLAALGIKGTGENPRNLGDDVVPVYDMGPFYASQRIETDTLTAAGQTAIGDGVELVVPPGEIWRLIATSGDCFNMTAADICAYFIGVRFSGSGQSVRIIKQAPTTVLATPNRVPIGLVIPTPLLLPAGSAVRAQLDAVCTNGADMRITVAIERLSI